MFETNFLIKGPTGAGQSVILERPDDTPCEQARLSWFSMSIWQREPVRVAALVEQFNDKLEAAAISRDFDRSDVTYRWTTSHDTAVELPEDLFASGRYWLSPWAWRL